MESRQGPHHGIKIKSHEKNYYLRQKPMLSNLE